MFADGRAVRSQGVEDQRKLLIIKHFSKSILAIGGLGPPHSACPLQVGPLRGLCPRGRGRAWGPHTRRCGGRSHRDGGEALCLGNSSYAELRAVPGPSRPPRLGESPAATTISLWPGSHRGSRRLERIWVGTSLGWPCLAAWLCLLGGSARGTTSMRPARP